MDLDTMWCREFTQMCSQLKASMPVFNIHEVDVPTNVLGNITKLDKCFIRGIDTEYYSELNETEVLLFGRSKLYRRKFDYRGEFIKDESGAFITEEVILHNNCVAVISDKRIGVPNSFKSDAGFDYVDMIMVKDKDGKLDYGGYVYIIPRAYCYKMKQTALVLSLDKLRNYYEGVRLTTTTGYDIFIYIIPYKPTSNAQRRYRILSTKTSIDYSKEITALRDYWSSHSAVRVPESMMLPWRANTFLFPPELCGTESGYKGRDNLAFEVQPVVLEEYVKYDLEKSMSNIEDEPDFVEENYPDLLDN